MIVSKQPGDSLIGLVMIYYAISKATDSVLNSEPSGYETNALTLSNQTSKILKEMNNEIKILNIIGSTVSDLRNN